MHFSRPVCWCVIAEAFSPLTWSHSGDVLVAGRHLTLAGRVCPLAWELPVPSYRGEGPGAVWLSGQVLAFSSSPVSSVRAGPRSGGGGEGAPHGVGWRRRRYPSVAEQGFAGSSASPIRFPPPSASPPPTLTHTHASIHSHAVSHGYCSPTLRK